MIGTIAPYNVLLEGKHKRKNFTRSAGANVTKFPNHTMTTRDQVRRHIPGINEDVGGENVYPRNLKMLFYFVGNSYSGNRLMMIIEIISLFA